MNQIKDLDNKLRTELIQLLRRHTPLTTHEGREVWLMNLPTCVRGLIPLRSENCRYDLAYIIDAIKFLQFEDGSWPLLTLIDAVLREADGLKHGLRLKTLRPEIESNLEQMESEYVGRESILEPCPPALEELIQMDEEFARIIQRDVLVKEIQEYLETPGTELHPIVLYGQSMAGKSNILKRLCQVLDDKYVPLMAILQGCDLSNLDSFLCDLASQLTMRLNEWADLKKLPLNLKTPEKEDFEGKGTTTFDAYWDHLRKVAGKRQPVVMFDEIERLLDPLKELDLRILALLEDFLHDSDKGYSILAGSERIWQSLHGRFDSLIDGGKPIRVPYFGDEIVTSCFAAVRDRLSFESNILSYITALCDGHPRVLQDLYEVIASLINESPGKRKIERHDIEPIVTSVIERTGAALTALWVRLSHGERDVVELVSKKTVLFDPVEVFECYLKELFRLADNDSNTSTMDYTSLRESISYLEERGLIEWKSKELFRFRLGILPFWRRYDRVTSIRS